WLLRVQPESSTDYNFLQALIEGSADAYCVVGRRDVRTVGTPKSEHQVLSPWLSIVNDGYSDNLTAEIIDVEVEGAQFGTDDLRLEASGADGYFPTTRVFFGRLSDFFIYQTNNWNFERNASNSPPRSLADVDLKRYVRAPVGTHTSMQDVTDA